MNLNVKKDELVNKKLVIKGNNGQNLFYTVKAVEELTADYIYFIDKFDKKRYFPLRRIEEII